METKTLKLLIKRGMNENDAKELLTTHFAMAIRMYPEAKASKLLEVISYLDAN